MLICGHNPSDDIFYRQKEGVNANKVTEILVDPQTTDKTTSGAALVAMFYFFEDGEQLDVRHYSTAKDAYFKENNKFGIKHEPPITDQGADLTVLIIICSAVISLATVICAFIILRKKKRRTEAKSF